MVNYLQLAAPSHSNGGIHLFFPVSPLGMYPPLPDATEVDFSLLKEEVCLSSLIPGLSIVCHLQF